MLSSIKYTHNFNIWPFNPTSEVRGVYKVKVFAYMLVYTSFPLIWYATWPLSEVKKNLTFWSQPTQGSSVCVITEYLLAWCSTFLSLNLIHNMTTSRKNVLTFWPHPWQWGCVCELNICCHVNVCVISFILICNKTIFRKSLILVSGPYPLSPPRG